MISLFIRTIIQTTFKPFFLIVYGIVIRRFFLIHAIIDSINQNEMWGIIIGKYTIRIVWTVSIEPVRTITVTARKFWNFQTTLFPHVKVSAHLKTINCVGTFKCGTKNDYKTWSINILDRITSALKIGRFPSRHSLNDLKQRYSNLRNSASSW